MLTQSYRFMVLATGLLLFGVIHGATTVSAQATSEPVQINSSPNGLIGLGLVGAEIGLTVPALAGLHQTWAFIVFPTVGAVGGALAGHYLLDNLNDSTGSIVALAVGMALIVPSLVITLSATAYDPSDEPTTTQPTQQTKRSAYPRLARAKPKIPRSRSRVGEGGFGLFRLSERGLALGVPAVSVSAMYAATDVQRYSLTQRSEVRVPVLSATF